MTKKELASEIRALKEEIQLLREEILQLRLNQTPIYYYPPYQYYPPIYLTPTPGTGDPPPNWSYTSWLAV